MFLNHIGKPSLYLPVCMVVWGLLSILTGKLEPGTVIIGPTMN